MISVNLLNPRHPRSYLPLRYINLHNVDGDIATFLISLNPLNPRSHAISNINARKTRYSLLCRHPTI
jgi:hypothetical protein